METQKKSDYRFIIEVSEKFYEPVSRTNTVACFHCCSSTSYNSVGRKGGLIHTIEFFTIGNSVRSVRPRSQLLLLVFVGIKYLLLCTNSSKGWEPEMTFTCKTSIVMIPKSHIVHLTDVTYLFIVKHSIIKRKSSGVTARGLSSAA